MVANLAAFMVDHVRDQPRRGPSRTMAVVALWLIIASGSVLFAPEAAAHTPHDNIVDIAPATDFAQSDTVFTISRARLMKSTDGGETWSRLVNGLDNRSVMSSLTTTAADPQVVYVATRGGGGVYRSNDGGSVWSNVTGDLDGTSILVIEASPDDEDLVVALGAGPEGVVSLSRTGGTTWEVVPDILEATAVAFLPGDPDFLAIGDREGVLHVSTDGASTWETTDLDGRRNGAIHAIAPSLEFAEDSTLFVGTEKGGLFTSDDGGSSFTGGQELDAREDGLTDLLVMDVTTAERPDGGMRLWVSTSNDGAFFSDDGGSSWVSVFDGLTKDEMADRIGAPNFNDLEVADAQGGDEPVLFYGTFDGLYRSVGIDQPWTYLSTQASTNIAGFDISPDYGNDQTIVVATYINGVHLSTDGGDSFAAVNDGLAFTSQWTEQPDYVARLNGVAFYPDFADSRKMFTGVRGYYFETTDAGGLWRHHQPDGLVVEGEFPADYLIPAFSPDFANDQTAFFGTDTGKIFRYSGDVESIERLDGINDVEIFTMAVSPDFATDDTIMVGTDAGVLTSRDGAQTFVAAETDVGDDITAMVVSPEFAADASAWVGTRRGLQVTRDGGKNFEVVADAPFGRAVIEGLAISPDYANDGTLLVSARGLGLFRSKDRGQTFEAMAPQLLAQQVVFESFYLPVSEPILFSPDYAVDRTIFGIADDHLYRSVDAGETWTTLDITPDLHDPTADAARPLLQAARFGESAIAADPDMPQSSFDTPIGLLSPKRVGAAALAGLAVAGSLMVPIGRGEKRHAILPSWKARAAVGLVVGAGALLVLAG